MFPRARELYLRKYPLEPEPQPADRFRTFLLEEEILESEVARRIYLGSEFRM